MEKSGGGSTVSKTVVETTDPPPNPIIVTEYVPVLVLELAEILRTDVAVGFSVTGLVIVHVLFAGQPLTVRPTSPLNPFSAVSVTEVFADPP